MAQNSNPVPGVARKRKESGEMQRCDDETNSEDSLKFLEYSRARGSHAYGARTRKKDVCASS